MFSVNDLLTRQLELFISKDGNLKELKRILSMAGSDEELLEQLRTWNRSR